MSFTWPLALASLVLVPLLAAAYLLQLRRRRRYAVRHPDISLVRAAMPARSRWKPHVPVALLLAAIAIMGLAMARPQASVQVPQQRSAIILAIDVSRSMCATDVTPNRLAAAQSAVRAFVADQSGDARLGLVVFSGSAALVVAPTTEHDRLVTALDSLSTGRGTAIGAALLSAVDAIAAINSAVDPVGDVPAPPAGQGRPASPPAMPTIPPPGESAGYVSDIIVLLTDGANTRGVLPLDAAKVAADRRIRVYPIGFGTANPTSLVCSSQQLGGDAFGESGPGSRNDPGIGGGGPQVPRNFLVVDEPTLKAVAATTGGTYHAASDADQLSDVLRGVPRDVVLQRENLELTAWFAALAALLVVAGLVLSVRWNPTS